MASLANLTGLSGRAPSRAEDITEGEYLDRLSGSGRTDRSETGLVVAVWPGCAWPSAARVVVSTVIETAGSASPLITRTIDVAAVAGEWKSRAAAPRVRSVTMGLGSPLIGRA